MRQRIQVLQWVFLAWVVLIGLRLAYWQVVKASDLKKEAEFQQTNRLQTPAARGEIVASDLRPLVTNAMRYRLYVDPANLPKNIDSLILTLQEAQATPSAITTLRDSLHSNLRWVLIGKNISPQTKERIQQLKMSGLTLQEDPVRLHPEGSSSAYITGFVGRSDNDQPEGYFGLEGYYNRLLNGTPGKIIEEKDAFGMPIVIGSHIDIPPQLGSTLVTSIDRVVQHIACSQLKAGLEKFQADSGTVTILDTQSGHVLAMTALPGYDAENYTDYEPELLKNPIVSDSYEPGSTFKTIVMASGLDAGVVTPQTQCDNCTKPLIISEQAVRNYDDKYYPQTTMTDVILHSDNIGMVFVARRLGRDRFLDYLKRFGIGQVTGIDLQEESVSPLRPPNDWYEIDWSTAAFGQGIAVTRLQLATAVNCLARLGECKSPRLVTALKTETGLQSEPPTRAWRAVSPEAAQKVTNMMTNGVNNGAVKIFKPEGYTIAGKTGTAQVPIAGHYDANKTIASFVGFAPVPNPRFTMLVTVSNPKTSPWGSTTAAPIWFGIAKELFRYFNIPAQYNK